MNVDGSAVLHAEPERVWSIITDPAVLARTIPGCLALEQVGDDDYRMQLSVGVGAVKGTYAGEVRLSDQQRPTSYVMHASGAGAPGNVRATVTIELTPTAEGQTTLTYSADAVVGGPVAGVGQRMMTGVAKRMAGQFFSAIDAELTGAAVPAAAPAVAAAPTPGAAPEVAVPAGATAAAPRVFAGRAAAPRVFAGRAAAAPVAAGSDARSVLVGVGIGSAVALLGVLVGYRLARRR